MARSVDEWIGKNDDAMPPPRVRQRIIERENRICHICKGQISEGKPWHADHVPPLKDGGENRESAIFPAHPICHQGLTAKQASDRAKVERNKQKASGAQRSKQTIPSAPFPGKRERTPKPKLPPRRIYGNADNG